MVIKYKDQLKETMTWLGTQPNTLVCGYNVSKFGGNGAGTFADFPQDRIQEMPLSENLMVGAAIGLSLDGWLPIVWFERFDFVLCAMDAIVNHLDKIKGLSIGLHKPAVILRIVVGNREVPLFTGATHTQNLTKMLKQCVSFPVVQLRQISKIQSEYERALERARTGISTAIIEFKDFWDRSDI